MPTLTPGEWMTLLGMIAVGVASFAGAREQIKGVKGTVGEILRQVEAFHKRLDDLAKRIGSVELEQARQDERIKALRLRNTQRLRLADGGGGEGGEG